MHNLNNQICDWVSICGSPGLFFQLSIVHCVLQHTTGLRQHFWQGRNRQQQKGELCIFGWFYGGLLLSKISLLLMLMLKLGKAMINWTNSTWYFPRLLLCICVPGHSVRKHPGSGTMGRMEDSQTGKLAEGHTGILLVSMKGTTTNGPLPAPPEHLPSPLHDLSLNTSLAPSLPNGPSVQAFNFLSR